MPVYSHDEVEYKKLGVGRRIRDERKRRGLTLKDLASALSISVGTLSAIENDKTSLDVDLLSALRQVFGVPFGALLPSSSARHFHIARHRSIDAHPALPMRIVSRGPKKLTPYHNRLWPLADAFVGKHIEPFEIEIWPAPDDSLRFISHNHEEFLTVLRGELECLVRTPDGLVREKLGPGDCIYFWSHLPHCIRSTGSEPARSLHVLCSLNEPADSEYATSKSGPMIFLMDSAHKSLTEQVASRIVSLRQSRGMSAAEFAAEVGISVRRLARIERAQAPVSLELLLFICRTFRKPREYFIGGTSVERPFHFVLRAASVNRRRPPAGRIDGHPCVAPAMSWPLAEGFPNRTMEPHLVRLDGNPGRSGALLRHQGQEFAYVLSGAVELVTEQGREKFTEILHPGDSCFIDDSLPHRLGSTHFNPYQKGGAEMIVVSSRKRSADALDRGV